MAPDVINLISSSPPPAPAPQRRAEASRHVDKSAGQQQPAAQGLNKTVKTGIASRMDDFLFLSDDFDTTIDLDESVLVHPAGSKRRRLSSPEKNAGRPSKRISPEPVLRDDRPSIKHGTRSRGNIALDDPIFSSSPDPRLLPSKHKPAQPSDRITAKTSRNLPKTTSNTRAEPKGDESDPFASSPRPQTRLKLPPPKARYDESSDLFASSPPPVTKSSNATDDSNGLARPGNCFSNGFAGLKATSPKRLKDWDPISSSIPEQRSFSSSPPARGQVRQAKQPIVIDIEDSESDVRAESEEEFPDIANFDLSKPIRRPRSPLRRSQSDVTTLNSRRSSKEVTKKSTAEKAAERKAKAAAKEAEKERQRIEKQQAKEAKAREKERAAALAEANKLRTDKKVSTPEMIVDIPSSLNPTISVQLETLLKEVGVQHTEYDSPVENVVKWRRKVTSLFNEDLGLWEPTHLRIEDESHALVVLTAEEFVNLALSDELEAYTAKMGRHYRNYHLIYLIEGLTPWMRKNRNIRNRQFTSGVRSREPTADQAQARRRKNTSSQEYIPEETIEDALLQLQVMHDALIHHTTIPLETAQWIAVFTQHISTIPYRKQRDLATLGAGFCMESGQVRTGDGAKDTYVRMLQEIVRVTAPIAYGIATEFDSVSKLVSGLEKDGPGRLEAVKKCANKDGVFSDRAVGQAVSRRMYKVFTGRDEASTDV